MHALCINCATIKGMKVIRFDGNLERALEVYAESVSMGYTEAAKSLMVEGLVAKGYIVPPAIENEAHKGTEG